jgi:hypothetical protein
MVNFVREKGAVTTPILAAEFVNTMAGGKRIDIFRIKRYVNYCVSRKIFVVKANGNGKASEKAG